MPFNVEEFFEVFVMYNSAVYPTQFVLVSAAVIIVYLAYRPSTRSNTIIIGLLSFLWMWMGIVYHLIYFSRINSLAFVFGLAFIFQAAIFLYFGVFRKNLVFHVQYGLNGLSGMLLIVYALILYPLLGYAFGHVYPRSPTFGLPCPTIIFTFGLMLWTKGRIPISVLIIPAAWSLIGFSAVILFGVIEDTGLLVAGIGATLLLLRRRQSMDTNAGRLRTA